MDKSITNINNNSKENNKEIKYKENNDNNKDKTIIIDYREQALITQINGTIPHKTENLIIGDIVFKKDNQIEFCIERKTVIDLVQSISDGRLREQRKRMLEVIPSKQCIYIIEGIINPINGFKNTPDTTVYSALINKITRDNIFVVRTFSINETSNFIKIFANKFLSNKIQYSSVCKNELQLKPRKKNDISVKQCFINQLSTIPTISTAKINAIIEIFSNMSDFILFLKNNDNPQNYLSEIIIGKKKLGKCSAQKIILFLGI